MPDVRVRMSVRGVELEFHGPDELFERAVVPRLAALTTGRMRVTRSASATGESPAASEVLPPGYEPPADRFNLFLRQLEVPSEAESEGASDRIAAYAFFLWNYEKKEIFHEEEVDGCFAADGQRVPGQPAAVYGDLLSRRVLAPGGADHTWRLTGKGRDYVRHHLLSA